MIEESEPQAGWRLVLDRVLATEFSLEDGTGAVWVAPDQLDLNLLGEGSFASIKQAEEALKILGLQASSAWGRGLRYRIWELRKGQPLIALGSVQQHFKLVGSSQHPVALSTAAEPTSGHCRRSLRRSWDQHPAGAGDRPGRRRLPGRSDLAALGVNAVDVIPSR